MENEQTKNTDWKSLSREERGKLLLQTHRIVKTKIGWRVPSQSNNGDSYIVRFDGHEPECNCPDCELRGVKCKHQWTVEYFVKQEIDREGNITQTKGMRVTYSQDWKAYDSAKTQEKELFMKLLNDLCSQIPNPEYSFGRPKLPLSDMVFASALKIYSTFSLRRFTTDMMIAKEFGYIDKVPYYTTVARYMEDKELTPILKKLIMLTSLSLKSVETDFAIDSSGFTTTRFARWFDHKYGKEKDRRVWFKAHLCSGIKTNIITSCEITEAYSYDSKELPKLIKETSENFDIKEVSGDKAYSSRENLNAIEEAGAIPFIPFRKNAKAGMRGSFVWARMYHFFLYKHDEFLEHYHKRSNAETVFHMIKSKFGDSVRSKNETAQINEVLLKILCHNVCVVIQEMFELGITAEFSVAKVGVN